MLRATQLWTAPDPFMSVLRKRVRTPAQVRRVPFAQEQLAHDSVCGRDDNAEDMGRREVRRGDGGVVSLPKIEKTRW